MADPRGFIRRGAIERVYGAARLAAVAVSFLFIFAVVAFAQSSPPEGGAKNQPGHFDFYVLALSWSPSYCEASAERAPERARDPQCGGRPFAFVVHGLWPQYEHGFPAFCQTPAPRLDRAIVGSALDMMPSPRLIFHEWDRHGTCSGLTATEFFDSVRKARATVKVPAAYNDLEKPVMAAPGDIADAFIKANPGLSHEGLAVVCDGKRLNEVRICMNKDFSFRDCPEVARRTCKSEKVAMPAVRGP
jgi:ribonuclease T2